MAITSRFTITSGFDVVLFSLSSLVTSPSFMSISSLVLELWQLFFIWDWPKIRKSQIPLPEFSPISGDWGKLETQNLARMSLMKCYWIIQNFWVTAFTSSELLGLIKDSNLLYKDRWGICCNRKGHCLHYIFLKINKHIFNKINRGSVQKPGAVQLYHRIPQVDFKGAL